MAERLNDLSGKEWLQNSFSIWRDIKKSKEEGKIDHPAMFPIELAERIIKIFTKEGQSVLDPFMGSGTTVIAATLNSRKAMGVELSEQYCEIAKERLHNLSLEIKASGADIPQIINDNNFNLLQYVKPNSVDLCFTSPPYWDILNMRRSADQKESKNYSDSESDLGNIEDYNEFLNSLKETFANVYKAIKPGGYCIVVVMDLRKKSNFYPLHSDLAEKMKEIGFKYDDIIIWDRQHEYNNMKPLGYPYKFRINKVHEYILIFSKEA